MKNYDEVANSIFKRRDEYIAKQKKKKRRITSSVISALCCCGVLLINIGLWKGGIFSSNIPVADSSQNSSDNSHDDFSQTDPNSSSNDTPIQENNSSDSNPSSEPSNGNSDSSQGEYTPNSTTPSKPTDDTSSNTTLTTPPSNSAPGTPPVTETDYFIDSIDKMNFYSAKKIINEYSLFPIGMNAKSFPAPKIIHSNINYAEYPIERDKIFTITMVTYFTMELNDEKGFLAQKLGGTGLIEVVVTKNDIEDMEEMITFKRNEQYYTCFMNGKSIDPNSDKVSRRFSTHKYIDGFNLVKNFEQENYKFTVHYEGSKVVGFECAPFNSTPSKYNTDNVTFIEDFCTVLYTKQNFTIDQLEKYFKSVNKVGSV